MIDSSDVVMVIMALCALVFVCIIGYAIVKDEQDGRCAYCNSEIAETADIVRCSDGRKYHAECYLRYIEEGKNGKTNSETP